MNEQTTLCVVGGVCPDETGLQVVGEIRRLLMKSRAVELHLCHVAAPVQEPRADLELISDKEDALRMWAQTLPAWTRPVVSAAQFHLALGEVPDALNRLARDVGADIIVVGSHENSRWRRLIEGDVLPRLVESAPCSVLVAMDQQEGELAKATPAPDLNRSQARASDGRYGYRRSIRLNEAQPTVGFSAF
ncbi:MAG: universal stress protein [Myxococcota bacterium]